MSNEELAVMVQNGCEGALQELWLQVEKFSAVKAKDYFHLYPLTCAAAGVTLDDLQQEAYFAFLDAIRYYDPERGYGFLTYMVYPLKNVFNGLCGKRTESGRQSALNNAKSLHQPIGEEDLTLADTIEDEGAAEEFLQAEAAVYHRQLHDTLEECLGTLPKLQEAAVRCRYYEGLTLEATGKRIGLSGSQSRSQEEKALKALRRGENRKRLEPFREDIISTHAYKSSFSLWKYTGMSSTEYTVLKLEQTERQR